MDIFAVRVNKLKTNRQEVEKALKNIGATFRSVGWYNDALMISNYSMRDLMEHELYRDGHVYIQNLSSMIPALVLDPEPYDEVLDVCAAPGSKTTQLGEYCNNACGITANDSSRERMFKLRSAVYKQGIENITFSNVPGEILWKKNMERYDKVLVDVPCSMGQPYAPKNLKRLIDRQKKLLRSGFSCVKTGGVLVYSTCSPRSAENQEVIAWFLKKEPHAVIEKISIHDFPEQWITEEGYVAISGDTIMGDFFIAKIRKKD